MVLGFIDRTEQLVIMKNSEYVIQPSLFEGWGTVVEDAKVLDKTILLSDIPVHREQMNEKCILFDPYDPVELAELIAIETKKEHHDDIKKGLEDMHARAKEYSKGFQRLLGCKD
jgi:glycosyltransferase involved in cell wall biosynthesis